MESRHGGLGDDQGGLLDETGLSIEDLKSSVGIVRRLVNVNRSGVGVLPPAMAAGANIPVVSGLKATPIQGIVGHTGAALTWSEPDGIARDIISGYNIWVRGTANGSPNLIATVTASPAAVYTLTPGLVLTYTVQTLLKSGQVSDLSTSPSCTLATSESSNVHIYSPAVNTDPARLYLNGNPTVANGFSCQEAYSITGLTSATTITRIIGTGSNGVGFFFRITASGHTATVGSGAIDATYLYVGGTTVPTLIATLGSSGSPPTISFDASVNSLLAVKLASSGGVQQFNGVMRVEWLIHQDFSNNTWTVTH